MRKLLVSLGILANSFIKNQHQKVDRNRESISKSGLESESNIAIDWFTKNEMIINPDKFQAIILDKKKSNLTNVPLTIVNQTIKSVPSVELLGIRLDDNLNFNLYVSNVCRSAANQLNALIRVI